MMTMRANSFAAVKTLCILIAHLTLRQLIAVRRPVMENNGAYYTILLASLDRSLSNNQSDYEGCWFTCQLYVTEIFTSEVKLQRLHVCCYAGCSRRIFSLSFSEIKYSGQVVVKWTDKECVH
jgi:hypothetical protein